MEFPIVISIQNLRKDFAILYAFIFKVCERIIKKFSIGINTLSYLSEINGIFCPLRDSQPLKKAPWHVLRGLSCPPSGLVQQSTADLNGHLAHFLKVRTCWAWCGSLLQTLMVVWCASNFINCAKQPLLSASGLPHPTTSLSRKVCRGQEGPKGGRKTLWGLINLCLKKIFATRNREGGCKEIQV